MGRIRRKTIRPGAGSWRVSVPRCCGRRSMTAGNTHTQTHTHTHTHTHTLKLNDAEGEAPRVQNGLGSLFVSAQTNKFWLQRANRSKRIMKLTAISTFKTFLSLVNPASAKLESNSRREREKKEGNDRWHTLARQTTHSNSSACFHPLLL